MEIETNLKECCNEAKNAFILLNKVGFSNVYVMCKTCEAILKLKNNNL